VRETSLKATVVLLSRGTHALTSPVSVQRRPNVLEGTPETRFHLSPAGQATPARIMEPPRVVAWVEAEAEETMTDSEEGTLLPEKEIAICSGIEAALVKAGAILIEDVPQQSILTEAIGTSAAIMKGAGSKNLAENTIVGSETIPPAVHLLGHAQAVAQVPSPLLLQPHTMGPVTDHPRWTTK
jgi:hypothetical protein